ncbi:hypothetical protein C8F01DRAFT_368995 [Mycena amicta]|nr:hypothetical protein C8F01DRAFT_368995 [Mycena amicta]
MRRYGEEGRSGRCDCRWCTGRLDGGMVPEASRKGRREDTANASYCLLSVMSASLPTNQDCDGTSHFRYSVTHLPHPWSLRTSRQAHSLAEYSSLSLHPSSSISASSRPFTLCYARVLRRRPFGGCAPCHIGQAASTHLRRARCGADLDASSMDSSARRHSPPCVCGRGWQMPGTMHIRM